MGAIWSSLFGSDYGLFTNPSGAWDRFKNGESNTTNKDIADQNLEFQRENLDYQKALQQQIFNREDSSYQRTVSDMRAAGLNPLSMTGTNAAGAIVPTAPLNNQYQHQDVSGLNAISSVLSLFQGLRSNQAQIDKTEAETDAQEIENDFNRSTADSRRAGLFAENLSKQIQAMDSKDQRYYNQFFNLNNSMSEKERIAHIALKITGYNTATYWKDGKLSTNPKLDWSEEVHPSGFNSDALAKSIKDFSKVLSQSGNELVSDIVKDGYKNAKEKVGEGFEKGKDLFKKGANKVKSWFD